MQFSKQKTAKKNSMLCYLAMNLGLTTLVSTKHDCVNANSITDGEAEGSVVFVAFTANRFQLLSILCYNWLSYSF